MNNKFTTNDRLQIPAMMMPGFRSNLAIQDGVQHKLLFKTWGGLGDQICAEPTIRYALNLFKDCEISLASEIPELFTHLNFRRVYHLKKERPDFEKYLCFDTITPPNDTNMVWQFMSHMLTNAVDFSSICALRLQLPVAEKDIRLKPVLTDVYAGWESGPNDVYVHAGRHWPSKTFPKWWWDAVLSELIQRDLRPILIGADTDDNRGTVDVSTSGCVDLRNKLKIGESIYLLQNAKVLLTNDSSPLHMAVSGNAWIGFIASCKMPDYIMHWRKNTLGVNQWAWRMENLGLGGMWDLVSHCPNSANEITVDQVDQQVLESWLPKPEVYAQWALSKVEGTLCGKMV